MESQNISQHDNAILNTIFNPNLPITEDLLEPVAEVTEYEPESAEIKESKRLELEGVQAAEKGDIQTALHFFCQAIEVSPERASCYNNRAQALRLQGVTQGALSDLNKAIELSEGKGKVACQSFTQRGLIERLEGHNEKALNDFKIAANLGGSFAKQQVIAMNPYAAMCNQMLGEVFSRMRAGENIED
ncbi:tetratricopeptide repeat protein 36-like [Lineus longissimus]|uniref:tetratricopeptide repeat protein 36-like n=1 Tax=Lineus longissimus TaxID=88925 RepID=UPI00315D3398